MHSYSKWGPCWATVSPLPDESANLILQEFNVVRDFVRDIDFSSCDTISKHIQHLFCFSWIIICFVFVCEYSAKFIITLPMHNIYHSVVFVGFSCIVGPFWQQTCHLNKLVAWIKNQRWARANLGSLYMYTFCENSRIRGKKWWKRKQ